jgi:hypothetical protein
MFLPGIVTMADRLLMRRGKAYEYGLRQPRRGLTNEERSGELVTIWLYNASNTTLVAGPLPASWDARFGGFVAQLAARTEAAGTVFRVRERVEIAGQPFEDADTTIELV